MPWTVRADGPRALLHFQPDDPDGLPSWSGWAEIFRGAPAWETFPELFHGLKSLQKAEIHQRFLSPWTWAIPDEWEGYQNSGEGRRYLILKGGRLNWTLVIRFAPHAPMFAFRELARAFNATPEEEKSHESSRSERTPEAREPQQGLDSRPAEVDA